MKTKRALSLAIECLRKEARSLAVDSNLAKLYGADYPRALDAKRRRAQLIEAAQMLEGLDGAAIVTQPALFT